MAIGDNLTKNEQIAVSVMLIAVAIVGLYWHLIYTPKLDLLAQEVRRIELLEGANQQARSDLSQGTRESLVREAKVQAASLNVMRELIPESNELPELLESVSNTARRSGLDLSSIEPLSPVPGEYFDVYRYRIGVVGDFHAIAEMIANIGSMKRIVAVTDFELTLLTPHSDQLINEDQMADLIANIEIQAFVTKGSGINSRSNTSPRPPAGRRLTGEIR